jgi:hypothetical protein
MLQYQYVCRITWGKFSYPLPPEWVFSCEATDEELRASVEKRWRVIKGTELLVVDQFKVLEVRKDVTVSKNQIGVS